MCERDSIDRTPHRDMLNETLQHNSLDAMGQGENPDLRLRRGRDRQIEQTGKDRDDHAGTDRHK